MEKKYTVVVKDNKYIWYPESTEEIEIVDNLDNVEKRFWYRFRNKICNLARAFGFTVISTVLVIVLFYVYYADKELIRFYTSIVLGFFSLILSMTFISPIENGLIKLFRFIDNPKYLCDLILLIVSFLFALLLTNIVISMPTNERLISFIRNDLGNMLTWASLVIFMVLKSWEQN